MEMFMSMALYAVLMINMLILQQIQLFVKK